VVNPSPFLFYLPFDDFCLIGSSPEILVRVEDGHGHDPPPGRHPPPGPDEAEDRAWPRSSWPTPRNAPSTSCSSTSANDVGRVADFARSA
jgi:anthranilate synthase component 1